jgi:hypothetical protein
MCVHRVEYRCGHSETLLAKQCRFKYSRGCVSGIVQSILGIGKPCYEGQHRKNRSRDCDKCIDDSVRRRNNFVHGVCWPGHDQLAYNRSLDGKGVDAVLEHRARLGFEPDGSYARPLKSATPRGLNAHLPPLPKAVHVPLDQRWGGEFYHHPDSIARRIPPTAPPSKPLPDTPPGREQRARRREQTQRGKGAQSVHLPETPLAQHSTVNGKSSKNAENRPQRYYGRPQRYDVQQRGLSSSEKGKPEVIASSYTIMRTKGAEALTTHQSSLGECARTFHGSTGSSNLQQNSFSQRVRRPDGLAGDVIVQSSSLRQQVRRSDRLAGVANAPSNGFGQRVRRSDGGLAGLWSTRNNILSKSRVKMRHGPARTARLSEAPALLAGNKGKIVGGVVKRLTRRQSAASIASFECATSKRIARGELSHYKSVVLAEAS